MTSPAHQVDRRGLVASSVHLRLGKSQVLRGCTLQARPGEMIAIIGTSGAGKTSLLHVLAGLVSPDEGTVALDGLSYHAASERVRRKVRLRHFGFVFQDHDLLPELTLLENAELPLLLRRTPRSEAQSRAQVLLQRLGIDGLSRALPSQVSGGQQQRAAIARALVAEPDFVFADEPTGSLDAASAGGVMDLLIETARSQATGVVLVTHDLALASRCDRVLALHDGILESSDGTTN